MMTIYEIDKIFGELSDELATELFLHWREGGSIECCTGSGWLPVQNPNWWPSTHYRAVRTRTPAVIPWDAIILDYKWYAEDKDGSAYLYTEKPTIDEYDWRPRRSCINISCFRNYSPSQNIPWEDSLVQRPDMASS